MATPDYTPDHGDSPETVEATPSRRGGIRPGTIIWGVIVALFGAAVIAWGQGLRFDVQLAAIGVLVLAGVVLVATSLSRSRNASP